MLHNEDLHNMYQSSNIVRQIKPRRMKWAGQMTSMGEDRKACRILVEKPEGKRPLERPRRRWHDGIKIDLRKIDWGCRVESVCSG
jgi:hypothetical protein